MVITVSLLVAGAMLVCPAATWGEEREEVNAPTEMAGEAICLEAEARLGTGLKEREIIGEAYSFPSSIGRVYCWTLVLGAEEPTEITHIWYYGEKKMAEVKLAIKSQRYRTWSCKTILPEWVGNWRVEVVDAVGNLLRSISFEVVKETEKINE
jgi:hypothetical protein